MDIPRIHGPSGVIFRRDGARRNGIQSQPSGETAKIARWRSKGRARACRKATLIATAEPLMAELAGPSKAVALGAIDTGSGLARERDECDPEQRRARFGRLDRDRDHGKVRKSFEAK
jgi:hypothetical protein